MRKILTKLFGDPNEAPLKPYQKVVAQVNALEPQMEALSDLELRELSNGLRDRLEEGETLDDLLPESFAATREAGRRTLGQRHFDVQLLGGAVLHAGQDRGDAHRRRQDADCHPRRGLNALNGRGVHVVTVNDYLAKRDTQWMGQVYDALGLSVACIQHEAAFIYDPDWVSEDERLERLRPISRREAYEADITYGTNNEFGFDYLRDNMVPTARPHGAARSDLRHRRRGRQHPDRRGAHSADHLRPGRAGDRPLLPVRPDRETAARRSATTRSISSTRPSSLTEDGIDRVEELLELQPGESIYDERYIELTHYLEQALKAHAIFHRDKDYIVRDGEVIIVDEFTGRMMIGRRYSEGLHQAIEAKEGVRVRRQNVTLATITFQNYFRMYDKLAGMTGTAKTEAEEFRRIYFLDVVVIPTNQPMVRDDLGDLVFKNERGKFRAVIDDIKEKREAGRPVLVGTASIEASERLSEQLMREGVPHQVLNAKQHEREAAIIAEAGQPQTRDHRHQHGGARHRHRARPRRARGGRPAHSRHRAPRSAPHRQPAARSRRTPGRSGLVAVLRLARRRADAPLRIRAHLGG